MKIWVLSVLIGCVFAVPSFKVHYGQTRNVSSLLGDISAELQLKAMIPLLKESLADPEVQRIIEYLNSEKFEAILHQLRNCPSYILVKDELAAEGVDPVEILKKIRSFVNDLSNIHYKIQSSGSLAEIPYNDFVDILDFNDIGKVIKKFKDDPSMKKLIEFLKGDAYKGIVDCMTNSAEVQELKRKLFNIGFDVDHLMEEITKMLLRGNYYVQARTIGSLLENMVQELGLRDVLPWIQEMIRNDPDVQRIVEYLKSDAFTRVLNALRACPGYQQTKDSLKAEGVDLVEILNEIRNFVTGSSAYHSSAVYYKIQPRRTLAELLDAALERMDVSKMINIIHDKFYNNPDLRKVIDFLKSDTFFGINACMKQNPDVQDLLQRLRDDGIDVDSFIDMIKTILSGGHDFYSPSSRTIGSLFEDLIDELGLKDVVPLIKQYLETDRTMQNIADYIREHSVFQKIEKDLRNCPGYPQVRDLLKGEGVDLVKILQDIRDFWMSDSRLYYRISGCLDSECDPLEWDITNRLDLSRIIKVLHEKIQTDPDMKKLIAFLKGDLFNGLVDCMKESKAVQDFMQELKDGGIDIRSLMELIKTLLEM